jgi:hypothetical protein
MKNPVIWDATPCGSCKNRVSEEQAQLAWLDYSSRLKIRSPGNAVEFYQTTDDRRQTVELKSCSETYRTTLASGSKQLQSTDSNNCFKCEEFWEEQEMLQKDVADLLQRRAVNFPVLRCMKLQPCVRP